MTGSAPTIAAVVAAGGLGTRFQSARGKPKQFHILRGRPIYIWSVLALAVNPRMQVVVLVVPLDSLEAVKAEVAGIAVSGSLKCEVAVTAGGGTRQESVRLGLESLAKRGVPPDYVLVHDAARPFIDGDTIDRVIDKVIECGACLVGVPASDTVKRVKDDKIVETPDRKEMYLAQTPQAGRFADLLDAHRQAADSGYATTDDASLLEKNGVIVSVVAGSAYNLKITAPLDLQVCEALSEVLLKDRL